MATRLIKSLRACSMGQKPTIFAIGPRRHQGAVATFAIIADLADADMSNLLADGLSMAAAIYAKAKAEVDDYSRIRRMQERHVQVVPVVTAAGVDPVWFGIFIVLMCKLGLIIPPVA